MALNPNPRPAFTPAGCDWLVWQVAVHALPALDVELRQLQRHRQRLATMLEERSLNATQRSELSAILDALARKQIIYSGADENPQDRSCDRKGSDEDA